MKIVLLHGSWHGAWCWHKVAPRLQAAGHSVHVPDLPGHGRAWRWARGRTTLSSMVDALGPLLSSGPGPAWIVVHSRSGIVASSAAERWPQHVAGLVYLASFMLRDGERAADAFASDRASLVRRHIRINRLALTDMLAEEAYLPALYADCDEADLALARALLTPEPSLPALTRLRLTAERYGRVPRHYIHLTQDRAVTIEAQRAWVAAQACATVRSIDASHSAYFSRPAELAAAIEDITAGR